MDYMRCLNCNGDIPLDSAFCPFCGANIIEMREKLEKERIEREQKGDNGELTKAYNPDATLKRAFLFLEDGAYDRADTYLENILDHDPENAWAYVGKLMIDLNVKIFDDLKNAKASFENNGNYIKAIRFGDARLKDELTKQNDECIENVKIREKQKELDRIYQSAWLDMTTAISASGYISAAEKFEKITEYKDSATLAKKCRERAEIQEKKDNGDAKVAGLVILGAIVLVILFGVIFSSI